MHAVQAAAVLMVLRAARRKHACRVNASSSSTWRATLARYAFARITCVSARCTVQASREYDKPRIIVNDRVGPRERCHDVARLLMTRWRDVMSPSDKNDVR